jgi:futalosine hydrolase
MLIVAAVPAEHDAILDGVRQSGRSAGITVLVGGVGAAATAATVARALTLGEAAGTPYDAVVSAGIGGGFADRTRIGGLAIGTATVAADLGAGSPDGFIGLAELGFGTAALPCDPALRAYLATGLTDAVLGEILTVNTVTGTADGTAAIRARHPEAVAEAMEGFGAATAASQAGVPFGEVRAVSNLVGPRDRAAWRIPAALSALTAAFAVLATVET